MARALTEKLDPELPVVEAIAAGDREAFTDFVCRQGKWVRGVIYGVLGDPDRVDDVAQHVWSLVWQQAATLRKPERWRSWLYRLTRNAAMDSGRDVTRRRKLNKSLREEFRGPSVAPPPHHAAISEEQRQLLIEAIRALPALYREPFSLRHVHGWSYREIGEVLDMPVDTVETRLVRARRQLREALKGKI